MAKINVECASIVDDNLLDKADAIVNASNPYMVFGSGVCGAIFKKAGVQELESYCKEKWKDDMTVGEIRITPGFRIPCDIIFAQGPRVYDYTDYRSAEDDLLMTYGNLLKTAVERGYKTVIIPSLGTGVYGFRHEVIAKPVLSLLRSQTSSLEIYFVNNNIEICSYYKKVLDELNSNEK